MTTPRRPLTALLSAVAALCAVTSCGIPTTGVVEAGGPASGVVPTVRIYLVADGALVAVPRRTVAPIDIQSVLTTLFQGPTPQEQRKGITTHLTPSRAVPVPTPTSPSTEAPSKAPTPPHPGYSAQVTAISDDLISVSLLPDAGPLTNLAASQIICTTLAAHSLTAPSPTPPRVNLTPPDGDPIQGDTTRCPEPEPTSARATP